LRPRELAVALAVALRDLVAPRLGLHAGRAHAHGGTGGDVTFAIDAEAEAFLMREAFARVGGGHVLSN
jgi:hypothetical protein